MNFACKVEERVPLVTLTGHNSNKNCKKIQYNF